MTKPSAVATAAAKFACAIVAGMLLITGSAHAEWKAPWKSEDKALVIDAYEFNPINWQELSSDERIAGFINKASDGLPPEWNCGKADGDEYKLCKNRWWKYSVTKELYMTRREMAKMKGLLWGAYHLGRPGNPREQADHFVDFAEPAEDDLIALDIEDNSDEWMSLADAEIFADQIKIRTGRYPVLYTNGSTAKYVSDNKAKYPLLSRLPLWYARYRDDITGKFPEETWPSYALWQFSSMHNCDSRSCPYRVKGAKTDIDVNVSTMDVAGLKAAWPFNELIERAPEADDPAMMIASLDETTKTEVAKVAAATGAAATTLPKPRAKPTTDTRVAAYAPAEQHARLDPLQLLTTVARGETKTDKPALVADVTAAPVAVSSTVVPSGEAAREFHGHLAALREAVAYAANEVDRLFIGRAKAATRTDEARPAGAGEESAAFDARQRSRFVEIVKAAEAAKKAGALPMPARVLSQLGAEGAGRGPRVAGTVAGQRFAGLDMPARRIVTAFEATR
ncbi:glycoside hydrolase family 25 protein [Aurantimonas marianensis]|uniref:Glycoside hydrolase family 25 protein n=1 Tax=Aurantimonas marianensis TaxID=2920428 RepID=A0A9X2H8E2_9HYPH|nr:glycoside hydrolase family 25 protein [Aurantimonas marianensis]MCP3056191.1 glycoside hydrolase family 25 protein [Aurantimonas marianensis]